jgi:hypothetical protein
VLSYGADQPAQRVDDHWVRTLPVDLLSEIQIVDTPGTNAIIRGHEALTRQFVPRADLIVFVTSTDRPYTESEREFLEVIRSWGKKIVFVVNKVDLLERDEEVAQVLEFVREAAAQLVGGEPTVFGLSARCALRGADRTAASGDAATEWRSFTNWLRQRLTRGHRVKLKLLSPIGVADKVTAEVLTTLAGRQEVLDGDGETLARVDHSIRRFADLTGGELEPRLDRIDNLVMALRERGEDFLDGTFRLARIRDLVSEERLQRLFEEEVVADAPDRIEEEVDAIIDWLIEREQAEWAAVRSSIEQCSAGAGRSRTGSGPDGFAARRRELLESVGSGAEQAVAGLDPNVQAAGLATSVQETLTHTALVEVGAIGLGLALKAILVSAAADATGILAAGVLAVFGLTLLPHRRRKAAEALRASTSELREKLRAAITEAVEAEIASTASSMRESVAPYAEFLRDERDRIEEMSKTVSGFRSQLATLRERIGALSDHQSEPEVGDGSTLAGSGPGVVS